MVLQNDTLGGKTEELEIFPVGRWSKFSLETVPFGRRQVLSEKHETNHCRYIILQI